MMHAIESKSLPKRLGGGKFLPLDFYFTHAISRLRALASGWLGVGGGFWRAAKTKILECCTVYDVIRPNSN